MTAKHSYLIYDPGGRGFGVLSFERKVRAVVTLEIFNVMGQKVRTFVSEITQQAGSYEVTWDGTDDDGREMGSGAYLARLRAGGFSETRKMILLK